MPRALSQRMCNFSQTFTTMERKILASGAAMGAIAIILGAFGAHALKSVLQPEQLVTFETGVRYQMYNALFLIMLSLLPLSSDKIRKTIWLLVVTGVILFSGSIYLLATDSLNSFDFKIIGFITPIGGLFIIVGWCMLLFAKLSRKS